MATELKPTPYRNGTLRLTQFCGPRPASFNDRSDRRCLQLTAVDALGGLDKSGYVALTKEQALSLAAALVEFANGTREEAVE